MLLAARSALIGSHHAENQVNGVILAMTMTQPTIKFSLRERWYASLALSGGAFSSISREAVALVACSLHVQWPFSQIHNVRN